MAQFVKGLLGLIKFYRFASIGLSTAIGKITLAVHFYSDACIGRIALTHVGRSGQTLKHTYKGYFLLFNTNFYLKYLHSAFKT